MNIFLSLLIPCHNEAGNIVLLVKRVTEVLRDTDYEIIFIDDGSSDDTLTVIKKEAKISNRVKYIHLSRNFGHQAALKAGIDHARGNCIVTMDADLQHPPEKIPDMIALWQQGYDVVNARRNGNGERGIVKRITASVYYKLLNKLTDENIPEGVADFRLFDRKVADVIRALPERDLYLRGLFAWAGFRQTTITYNEEERKHGDTKYNLWRMLRLAGNGITSLSTKPLKLSLTIGVIFAFIAFAYGIYAIAMLIAGQTVTGWTSVIASILFLSGIQLIVLGILGEYLGKLFMENKRRPVYIVKETNLDS